MVEGVKEIDPRMRIENMESAISLKYMCKSSELTFKLSRKCETFGDIAIEQFWVPISLLKLRNEPAPESIYRSFCEGFRTICMTDFSDLNTAAEVYVLARLCPHMRSRGALSIFLDAHEAPKIHKKLGGNDLELQTILTDMSLDPMTVGEFKQELSQLQTCRSYSDEEWELYQQIQQELLGDVADLWLFGNHPDNAFATVLKRWNELNKKFGRRCGFKKEKTILDAISYEAAAAFRRCYSAVWSAWILPSLKDDPRHKLSRHSYRFLEYWHQQIVILDPNDSDSRNYPFHGHCFGLHPASGRFLKTQRGRELVGAWLNVAVKTDFATQLEYSAWKVALTHLPEFGRMLRGYFLAYHHYYSRRDDANFNRRR
jgi:hypothetical protein